MINLENRYKQEAVPVLCKSFDIKNVHEIPKIKKITLSIGIGSSGADKAYCDKCKMILSLLSGQKPIETVAKKSIANFKLRAGQSSGFCVTMRGKKTFNFLSKLIYIAFPRQFDFNGFTEKNFDTKGNFSIGLSDVSVFNEISHDITNNLKIGMNISFSIHSKLRAHAPELMRLLDFPVKKAN